MATLEVSADKNVFVDSTVNGTTKISGKGNMFIRTVFNKFTDQPLWLKIVEILSLLVGTIFTVLSYYKGS